MTTLIFSTLLVIFAAWWLVNAAYDADTGSSGDEQTADRIRHATRCRVGYTPPVPGVTRACRPAHDTVKAFYASLQDHVPHAVDNRPTFLPFETALAYVADHPGWRLRKIGPDWRVIRSG